LAEQELSQNGQVQGSSLLKQVVVLTLFKLLLNTGRRFVYPFAPVLSRGLFVPLTAITSIIAASQFTSIMGLFCGPLADRFGYRTMMRSGLAVLCLGLLLSGLFPTYWVVFLGLLAASLGKTLFDPAMQAFIGHNIPFQRRGRVIGIVEMSWAGSTLLGIPFLGLVIARSSLSVSFFLLSFLGFLGWIGIGRILLADEKKIVDKKSVVGLFFSLKRLMKNRQAAGMLGFGFWISIANDCLFVVYGAWFEQAFHVSLIALGFSTVTIGVAELCGESLTSLFADRLGLKRAIIFGLTLAMVSYFLLPIIGYTLPLAMTGMFMIFLAFEISMVSSFSLSTELMPEARATLMAGFYATSGVGRMIGVFIGAILWKMGGITLVAWMAGCLTGIGLLSLLWGLRSWDQEEIKSSTLL